MAVGPSSQNSIASKPTLKDALDLLKKDIMLNLNCHAIGTIQVFDPTKQTAQVSINYVKTYYKSQAVGGVQADYSTQYPLLIDVPVIILHGGPTALTFPITTGDTCLVLFNDRDMDNFITTGASSQPVASPRLHSLADGIALVGLNPMTEPITPYDTLHVLLSWGLTQVGVSATQARIANAATTLGIQLQTFTGAITALDTALTTFAAALAAIPPATTVTGAIIKPPAVALGAAVTAVQVTITSVQTALGLLLE